MAKKKLARFAEMEKLENVFQARYEEIFRNDHPLKGKWGKEVFRNDHPIVLEIGCGKGEYTVGLGKLYPEKNFIGIDIKGARMWHGAKAALEQNVSNAIFLRIYAEMLASVFAPGEISEIWITFPDPQPSKPNKRLCSPAFLDRYRKIFPDGKGVVHLKTDDTDLYEYCLNEVVLPAAYPILHNTADLYASAEDMGEASQVQTTYEKRWLAEGRKIKYLCFKLT